MNKSAVRPGWVLIVLLFMLFPLSLCTPNGCGWLQIGLLDAGFAGTRLPGDVGGLSLEGRDVLFSLNYTNLTTKTPLTIGMSDLIRVDSVNLTLWGIHASNYTIRIAEDLGSANSISDQNHSMAFTVEKGQTYYLYNISLFLIGMKKHPIKGLYINFAIYNASWNGTHVIPDKNVSMWIKSYDLTGQGEVGWKTIDLAGSDGLGSALPLDPSNTANETFFVVIGENTTISRGLSWAYTDDPASGEGYGPAYNMTSGVTELPVDYSMRVYLSPSVSGDPEVPTPSEINLMINGTPVTDSGEGRGTWSLGGLGELNSLVFDFNSTWPGTVTFSMSVEVYGTSLYGSILLATLLQGYGLGLVLQSKEQADTYLILAGVGAVVV
ncbi:MAG: hypothetical protein ACTSWF_08055, partial [Candidatus Freyarchaeota archaeon]